MEDERFYLAFDLARDVLNFPNETAVLGILHLQAIETQSEACNELTRGVLHLLLQAQALLVKGAQQMLHPVGIRRVEVETGHDADRRAIANQGAPVSSCRRLRAPSANSRAIAFTVSVVDSVAGTSRGSGVRRRTAASSSSFERASYNSTA